MWEPISSCDTPSQCDTDVKAHKNSRESIVSPSSALSQTKLNKKTKVYSTKAASHDTRKVMRVSHLGVASETKLLLFKITMSLVYVLLKFQMSISQIHQYFLLKKCGKLLNCKSFSHLFIKNISVFGYKVVKHLKS